MQVNLIDKIFYYLRILGAQIGNVLTLSIGGLMCSWNFAGGWKLIFYSVG